MSGRMVRNLFMFVLGSGWRDGCISKKVILVLFSSSLSFLFLLFSLSPSCVMFRLTSNVYGYPGRQSCLDRQSVKAL